MHSIKIVYLNGIINSEFNRNNKLVCGGNNDRHDGEQKSKPVD